MSARTLWRSRASLVLAALILLQSVTMVAKAYTDWKLQFGSNFLGFNDLDTTEFYSLVADHTEVPILLTVADGESSEEQILSFTLFDESSVYMSASADSTETVFIHPLLLQREDERRYLLPLIRSSTPGRLIWNSINLGRFSAGEHTVILTQDASVNLPIPDSLQLRASRPSSDSKLAVFIDHSPVIKLKDLENVLDDMPLMGYSSIYRRDSRYLVSSNIIFSSENGGTMPVTLMAKKNRTLDIEWVMKQIFEVESDNLDPSHRLFQKRSHGEEKFEGKELLGNRPVLTVATDNNNFGDGQIHLWRWTISNPFVSNDDDPIYYAPKPIFLPPGDWSWNIVTDIPELQVWSQYELAMELCVDTRNHDNPFVQGFVADLEWVKQHLDVSFPDRGCGGQMLVLAPKES